MTKVWRPLPLLLCICKNRHPGAERRGLARSRRPVWQLVQLNALAARPTWPVPRGSQPGDATWLTDPVDSPVLAGQRASDGSLVVALLASLVGRCRAGDSSRVSRMLPKPPSRLGFTATKT